MHHASIRVARWIDSTSAAARHVFGLPLSVASACRFFSLGLLILALPAQGQTPDWSIRGVSFLGRLGLSMDAIPDVDGDGAMDLLVAEPRSRGPLGRVGAFRVVSGRTGVTLRRLGGLPRYRAIPLTSTEPEPAPQYGTIVRNVGDVDADGVADYAVNDLTITLALQSPVPGRVHLFSGATGLGIFTVTQGVPFGSFGSTLDAVGDINGDGHADVVIGDQNFVGPGGPRTGAVYVYSGRDASVLLQVTGATGGSGLGGRVAGLDDVDGDGVPDLAIHVATTSASATYGGRVSVASGATGATLYSVDSRRLLGPATATAGFGSVLVKTGDLDGDGIGDFAVGDCRARSSVGFAGAVWICSGADGSEIRNHVAETSGSQFGAHIHTDADFDGDGIKDVMISDPYYRSAGVLIPRIYVFSGASGALIDELLAPATSVGVGFGWAVATGDFNGDGVVDVSASEPFLDGPGIQSGGVETFFR
ncbi:MAG: FG-GAP-like repeat-containing protein [Planctomycetota bacterium]